MKTSAAKRLFFWGVIVIAGTIQPHSISAQITPAAVSGVDLSMTLDIGEDGAAGPMWISALGVFYDEETLPGVLADQHLLTDGETAWADLIQNRQTRWSGLIERLRIPFGDVTPPETVYIVMGNVGGQDAFTPSDTTIAFDLQRLALLYGDAAKVDNGDRIDRFFAHEFTHLIHKAWRKAHNPVLDTPLDRALWDCLVEGIGNYRSLSSRWVDATGNMTPHAREVLDRLQVVFVDRIAALADATEAEEAALIEGLSMGPFEQKWGALTSALWLAQEAQGDDRQLQPWVEAGPKGILELARKHLPEELGARLPPGEH